MATIQTKFFCTGAIVVVLIVCTMVSPIAFPNSDELKISRLIPGNAISEENANRLIEEFSQKIKAHENESGLYIQRGSIYLQIHKFDNAIQDFTEAIRLSDADLAYFGRGMALGRGGLIDDGIKDLGIYILRHPQSSIAHTKRGVRYLWQGKIERAKNDFLKAISLDADNAEAHDDLGVIYARARDYDKAIDQFKNAIRLEPTYYKAYYNLALTYYLTEREQEALNIIDHAIKLRPEARDSLLLKAQLLNTLGRHQEADPVQRDAESLRAGDWSERMPVK